jgi:hypothetical protein
MVIPVSLLAIMVLTASTLLASSVAGAHGQGPNATPSALTDSYSLGRDWSPDVQPTIDDQPAPVYPKRGFLGLLSSATGPFTPLTDSPRTVAFQRDTYRLSNIGDVEGESHSLFAPKGVKALATRWTGTDVRIELSPLLSGWVPLSNVAMLPPGTPPPRAVLGTVWTYGGSRFTRLGLALSEAVPSRVEIKPNGVRLVLYYTEVHTNTIVYGPDNPMLREVRCSQEADGLAHVDVWLTPAAALWDYDLAYEPKALTIELRWPPPH